MAFPLALIGMNATVPIFSGLPFTVALPFTGTVLPPPGGSALQPPTSSTPSAHRATELRRRRFMIVRFLKIQAADCHGALSSNRWVRPTLDHFDLPPLAPQDPT